MKSRAGAIVRVGAMAALVGVADQYTKWEAVRGIQGGREIEIIPGFFNLILTYNTGAAFGLFSNLEQPLRGILLGGTTILAIGVVLYFLFNEYREDRLGQLALGMILGGAIGNIIDRVRLGRVVDFLDVYLSEYHWPAFNLADSAICIGVALLILHRPRKARV